jgi:ribosomal protein L29
MKMSELKEKTISDVIALVHEKREELRKLTFGTAGSGTRNVKKARTLRREVAQALTELKRREDIEDSK